MIRARTKSRTAPGKLVSVHAAQRIAEHSRRFFNAEVGEEKAFEIAEIIIPRISLRMIGIPVPTLVRCYDAPLKAHERRCQRSKGDSLHPVRVQGHNDPAVTLRIEIRQV